MKRNIKLAAIGVLGAVTVTTALAATEQASAVRGSANEDGVVVSAGGSVARGGDGGDGGVVVQGENGGHAVARGGDGGDAVAGSGDDSVVVRGEDGEDGGVSVRGEDGEDAVARGEDGASAGGEGGDAALEDGQVLMKMEGDEGVVFSGTCTVDGKQRALEGRVPQEFTFEIGEGELDCEIRKEGEGTLKMVLVSGNDRVVQKIKGDGTLRLNYSGDGVSSSTSGSSSSVVQSN